MLVSALLGNPTDHSFSPKLFTIYAKALGDKEYSHVKFNILPEDLEGALRSLHILGFCGANITLPYKMDVMPFLDYISEDALSAGAVNTIKVDGKTLRGFNTDVYGAMETIRQELGHSVTSTDNILIFGTGGAARALASGFLSAKCQVTVIFRDPGSPKTKSFTATFGKKLLMQNYEDLRSAKLKQYTIICNATNLGMTPNVDSSPLDLIEGNSTATVKFNHCLFFDVVFNPQKTKFMGQGENLGAKIVGGTNMMIYQGVIAFKLWTGCDVTPELLLEAKSLLQKYI